MSANLWLPNEQVRRHLETLGLSPRDDARIADRALRPEVTARTYRFLAGLIGNAGRKKRLAESPMLSARSGHMVPRGILTSL